MQLGLGSLVMTADGRSAGRVSLIILDPETLTVRQFVARQGVIFRHNRFVAAAHVDYIDDEGAVHLSINADEVRELPQYVPAQNTPVFAAMTPHPTVRLIISQPGSVPLDMVVLSHRTEARDFDGRFLGYLDKVECRADGRVNSIVLEAGDLMHREWRLPAEAIASIRNDRITVQPAELHAPSPVPA